MSNEKAILGGGCFWCLEAHFQRIDGVKAVTSAYAGGSVNNPSYEDVCTGQTGHAEIVLVEYDPAVKTYEEILEEFWRCHDPTQLNRQGNDVGTQYRSVIFYTDEEQKKRAQESLKKAQARYPQKIVTQVEALGKYWPAEAYHQDYFNKHPENAYCRLVIQPKLKKAGLPI